MSEVDRSAPSLLTADRHADCGAMLYRVGSDQDLFCASCQTKVSTEHTEADS